MCIRDRTEGDGEQKDNLVEEQPITFAVPRISSEEELPVYKVGEKGGLDGLSLIHI